MQGTILNGLELAPIVFGLTSAACWGAADFCGGLAAKRTQAYRVVISSQIISLFMLLALAIFTHEAVLPIDRLLLSGVAGMFGAVGMLALYRALADGHMGVAAPVSAVVAAAVPVIAGAFIEGLPGLPQLIGFGLAFLAVWLVSQTTHVTVHLSDLGLPFLAGLSFGIFFVIIGSVGQSAVWWPLIAARIGSLSLLIGLTLIKRQGQIVARPLLTLAVIIGVLEVGGNACYILARQAGRLDVAAVLASLYPAATVLLARVILKEHVGRSQVVGIATALAAIVLITL
jgi:drug/metabolite transporter (DMT)-like permease